TMRGEKGNSFVGSIYSLSALIWMAPDRQAPPTTTRVSGAYNQQRSSMDVSMKQLRVFLAIVETRNFSLAGEQVGLSQPAVSRAIRELEARLDVRLFDRSTREVRLSEAGEILSQRLPRWMDELDHILLDLSDWAGSRRGKVRVASSPTISAHLMPYSLARCAEAEPDIEVMLLDRIQQDVLASVLTGEVDFGVIVEPSQAQLRELHSERIML